MISLPDTFVAASRELSWAGAWQAEGGPAVKCVRKVCAQRVTYCAAPARSVFIKLAAGRSRGGGRLGSGVQRGARR